MKEDVGSFVLYCKEEIETLKSILKQKTLSKKSMNPGSKSYKGSIDKQSGLSSRKQRSQRPND